MSDNPRAREALRSCLPDCLKDHTFVRKVVFFLLSLFLILFFFQDAVLKEDPSTKKWLSQLLINLETPVGTNTVNVQGQPSGSVVGSQNQPSSPLGMG